MKLSISSFAFVFIASLATSAQAAEPSAPAKATPGLVSKTAKPAKKKAGSKKPKESVKKIAVGPSPTPAPQIQPANAANAPAVDSDDTDAIDQPIPRAVIESTDAPGVKLEAGSAQFGAAAAAVSADALSDAVEDTAPVESTAPAATQTSPTSSVKTAAPSKPERDGSLVELHDSDEVGASAKESARESTSKPSDAEATSASAAPSAAPLPTSPTASASDAGKAPVTAEQSLKWLLNGNTRFVNKTFRADGRSAEDRLRSSTEQKPHAIILACSESITPPELIFDQGIGEITTIRVAGPQLDTAVIASLEQAVRNFDSQLILVLGHTQCSSLDGSPYIGKKQVDPHSKNEVEAALNADGIARDLTSKSAFLKSRVDAKQLTIKSGLYWVDTGKVKLY